MRTITRRLRTLKRWRTHLQVLKHGTRASLCSAACCTELRKAWSRAHRNDRRTPASLCSLCPCAMECAHVNAVCRMARVAGHCRGCICAQQRRSSPRLGRLLQRSLTTWQGTARCCILSLSVMLIPAFDACASRDWFVCTGALFCVIMQPNSPVKRTLLSFLVRWHTKNGWTAVYNGSGLRHGRT